MRLPEFCAAVFVMLQSTLICADQYLIVADPAAALELDELNRVLSSRAGFRPTENEVSSVVTLVGQSVAGAKDWEGSPLYPFSRYGLQLIGVEEEGVRYVVVFGFCDPADASRRLDLRVTPAAMKGGGKCFFSGKYRTDFLKEEYFYVNAPR